MKLQLYFFVLMVGLSTAFIPRKLFTAVSGAWSSINHKIITQSGLWCTVIEFLNTNPKYLNEKRVKELVSVNTAELIKGRVSSKLFRLVKSSKFKDAVKEIEQANADVDRNDREAGKTAAHFDAEQFRAGSKRLIRLKKEVISLIENAGNNEVDYTKARKEAGRLLHTLQDFYSHSNWIEAGNNDPLLILGTEIIGDDNVAGADERTCKDCTPASRLLHTLGLGSDNCHNNLLNTKKLTSGYYSGQDVAKPVGVGKCSHGGILDKTRKIDAKGGINKDSTLRYLSPHYKQHKPAARVAIKATKLFFDGLRKDVGDKKFAKFLNMESPRTLSFAIDTTGSMSDEIAAVQQATIQFIEDAAADDSQDFRYVLVPFNDPGVGPVLTTGDPEVAKQTVNALTAFGGGDCPELGMTGLYLALLSSLPNSDVYYFSDAAAKDAHLIFSVLAIALQRQSRIYILLSGTCGSRRRRSLTGRQVYEKLAGATGGQLIEFSKSNINEAIKLVRQANVTEGNSSSLQEVSLLSVEDTTNVDVITKSYVVHSDSTIASITAVLSAGGNANIQVVLHEDGNGTISIVSETPTIYAVRIIMPTAGVWNFTITALGSFTFQVTARSTLDFTTSLEKAQYSDAFENILVPISGNPIKGTTLYVTVEPTEDILQADTNITGYLIDSAGNRLESFELEQGRDFYNNSYFGSIQLTYDAFKIKYVGYSKDGEKIQRLQPRVIRPQEFEVEIAVQNSSLSLTPNETTSIIVVLRNHGSNNTFAIQVTDDKSFVASYSPQTATVASNDTVNIQINFFAPWNTNDSTTTSVSVSASIQSASTFDLANFISFEVSVFSKEFLFVNETEVTSKMNISSRLSLPDTEDMSSTVETPVDTTSSNDESDDGLALYAIVLIAVASALIIFGVVAVVAVKAK